MLTNQQAALIDHLRKVGARTMYIKPQTALEQRIAPKMLPLINVDDEKYGGSIDELSAYYETLNEARKVAQA